MRTVSLTDLHTHILPNVDDGAADITEALNLLKTQKSKGVDRVLLTPHFNPQKQELQDFLAKRDSAYKLVMENYDSSAMPELRLGAEIMFSPDIIKLDLKRLTLGDSDYLLIELDDLVFPPHLSATVSELTMIGITPVLAHVERCLYFRKNPYLLYELTLKGAVAHVTAETIGAKYDNGFCKALLNKGYVHFAASDTHDSKNRPPNLAESLENLSSDLASSLEDSARCIWDNVPLYPFDYQKIIKVFGKYH
ncbi:MAG: hypothetical protein IJP21_02530 [Clostridia bacterium]|nr:hypothetical protein [Clostridia bacterium]